MRLGQDRSWSTLLFALVFHPDRLAPGIEGREIAQRVGPRHGRNLGDAVRNGLGNRVGFISVEAVREIGDGDFFRRGGAASVQPDHLIAASLAREKRIGHIDPALGAAFHQDAIVETCHAEFLHCFGGASSRLAEDVERPGRGAPAEKSRRVEIAEGDELCACHVSRGVFGRSADIEEIARGAVLAEPVKLGGLDSGPGPYDFLLAGLGACTAMTIRLYADFKKIPLANVSVRLNHEKKIHVKDCEDCDNKVSKVDHIDRAITLEGPLDAEQRKRLMEIADKCPVHQTLESKIDISTIERPA